MDDDRPRRCVGLPAIAPVVAEARVADLDDVATAFRGTHDRKMRVATKYVNLTRHYFSQHGIIDYRIVESLGATEGAPAAGTQLQPAKPGHALFFERSADRTRKANRGARDAAGHARRAHRGGLGP